ncbi:hypothetical protein QQZ08_005164 [Neonectria magnoliae]|uniref:FAD/NAD(P)-binding domain-containing protein n=1 Tax=Neonectria magnoliae TaxID=2732573 RepID=A0ABR1I5W5_9HYPO
MRARAIHRVSHESNRAFGVFQRTKFNTKVYSIKAIEAEGWEILVSETSGGAQQILQAKKLIVATGLTSQPNMPSYSGLETFTPLLFHAKDFCTHSHTVNDCQKTIVVGGGNSAVIQDHGYEEHPELFKLKPWQNAFWTGSGIGIHNYPTSFFDLVKEGKIRVHITDITKLDGTTVHLTSGEAIETEVMVCASGWKKESNIKFLNFSTNLSALSTERYEPEKEEPLRNCRFVVPSGAVFNRNIAFADMVSTTSTSMFATTQALWISAFFDGKLKRSPNPADEVTKEIMLHSQFGNWRYPCGYGASLPPLILFHMPNSYSMISA